MKEVQKRAMIPPSLRGVYRFFQGCGYVAIVACISFVVLAVATFMGYQAEDAMLGAMAITLGFGCTWMFGRAFTC